jgi:hypothetical protein
MITSTRLNTTAATDPVEPPFAIAQLLVLALFVVLGIVAVKRFHPAAVHVPAYG